MKAVLISIQPKWCELIASGQKTIEVRKSKPKLEEPFKVYIYCTQGDALAMPCLNAPRYSIHRTNNGTAKGRRMTAAERMQSDHLYANGKVIGEFVCDRIDTVASIRTPCMDYITVNDKWDTRFCEVSCLNVDELAKYLGFNKDGYAWHISNLVIYDKPIDLSEFERACPDNVRSCAMCRHSDFSAMKCLPLTRPPQSWCYVEERSNDENTERA